MASQVSTIFFRPDRENSNHLKVNFVLTDLRLCIEHVAEETSSQSAVPLIPQGVIDSLKIPVAESLTPLMSRMNRKKNLYLLRAEAACFISDMI